MSATSLPRAKQGNLLAILCFIASVAAGLLAGVSGARAGMEPGPGNAWLTIASRSNPSDAVALAQQYAGQFPTVVVFEGSNGYYAISLGWID